MKIYINGNLQEVTATTVESLLQELNLLPTQVAIEHNGTVLFRHEFSQTSIRQTDRIEIVRVVAGGCFFT